MIKKSLIRLNEAVQSGMTLLAGSKVVLPIVGDAEIYGFIAILNHYLISAIDMPPLGECQVLSNRVIFTLENNLHRFPIFKSVGNANEDRYALYLLYVPELKYSRMNEIYGNAMCKNYVDSKTSKLDCVRVEDNIAYYYPKENSLYFESASKLRAVSPEFAVITRRISENSDDIKYEIFDSQSVLIERK